MMAKNWSAVTLANNLEKFLEETKFPLESPVEGLLEAIDHKIVQEAKAKAIAGRERAAASDKKKVKSDA